MVKKAKPLFTGSEWDFKTIQRVAEVVEKIGKEELGLDFYPNQIEIIDSAGMIDAYTSFGLPIMYKHWSFGKRFLKDEAMYRKGYMGLAYEIVINSNPCISYLMEENSMTMQTLVIAHACCGHNHFFKNNYLFKQWTDASAIIDYLVFARDYVNKCEEKYGVEAVERVLDACHAIQNYGVDRYKRPRKPSLAEEISRQEAREEYVQQTMNDLWRTLPRTPEKEAEAVKRRFPEEPQENLLYFIEKNSPVLASWERELVRIVRKVSQYFYPQRQTKLINEGFATFIHYEIMNRLWEKGLITEGSYLEFIQSHTNVVMQPPFDHRAYSGINPYALGFAMFRDIKRICEAPTEEDRQWFPDIAGTDFIPLMLNIVENYRDESFVRQFLSPKVIRDWHMFKVHDSSYRSFVEIESIHNESGYRSIRAALAKDYDIAFIDPDIQVWDVDHRGDRTLQLRHVMADGISLHNTTDKVLKHVAYLWGYPVKLESFNTATNRAEQSYSVLSERNK